MGYQSNFNVYTAFKAQSGLGVPASGSGATVLRWAGARGGLLTKTAIQSNEIRADAQRTRGRHGFQKTAGGPYDVEMSIGAADGIMAALLRGSWDASFSVHASDFTSITISGNVITWAGGNPINKGFRTGDVIELTGSTVSGNNGRNLRSTLVTSSAITVAETLTDAGSPDTGATIVRRGRKVIMPAANALTKTYFSVEEYDVDIDQSAFFSDCFWNSGKWSMSPDGLLMFAPSWVGTGQVIAETTGNSPVFTTPTTPTGVPLAVLDATVRLGSTDLADLTAFDLTIDNGAVAPQVVGSKLSPTVMPGQNSVSMNLSVLRTDLSNLQNYIGETGLSLHVLAVDTSSEPKNFISLNVPFFTLGGVEPSAPSTAGGARTETLSIPAALIGQDTTGSGYDATMMSIQISNLS